MAAITALFDVNIDNVAHLFLGVENGTNGKSSPDGITSTTRTLANSNFMGMAFGNDIAVAVSATANSTVASSSIDGITWVARTLPAAGASRGWYGCAFGATKFVATTGGGATTVSAQSADGITWNSTTIGSGDWRAVAFGAGKFVAVNYGSNSTQISTDSGATWGAGGTLPSSKNWIDIVFDSGLNRFVAIASGDTVAYSDDGLTWSGSTLPFSSQWRAITTNNNGRFVMTSNQAAGTVAAYSDGGIIWSGSTLPAAAVWECIAYGRTPGVYYASSNGSTNAATSTNGINWVLRAQANESYNKTIFAEITWRTNDTLTINNSATVTVNTDQKKFWSAMTITNGRLLVTNSSTTTANRFITGRSSGTAAQALTPGSGLGSIVVQGDWVQIGTGNTLSGQTMTLPYTDYVPCVWVETGSTYEMWLNITSAYGGTLKTYNENGGGFSSVSNGRRGKFFVQTPNPTQNRLILLTGCTTVLGSRIVTVPDTSNIMTGAYVSGTTAAQIPVATIVEEIISPTTLSVNLAALAATSTLAITFINPTRDQFTNQIVFGDDINGNTLPLGAKVKVPNLMLTSDTPVNLQTATIVNTSAQAGMSFVLTNGGRVSLNTCLFGEAYHNFNQAQSLSITDVGMSVPPAISEVYDLNINGLGLGLPPRIRAFSTSWIYRDVTNALQNILPMSYITGAVLNNIAMVTNSVYYATAGSLTAPVGFLNISYSNDLTVSNIRCYSLFEHRGYHYSIALPAAVNNSTFTNIESYGLPAVSIQQSSNNTFTNIIQSESMFSYSWTYTAGHKVTYDPETGENMIDGKKYYFKSRTFFTRDRSEYTESREYSSTPFLASGGTQGQSIFPDYVTAYCNNNGSALFGWTNRSPVNANPSSYEIHRSTLSGFTIDGAESGSTTKVFKTQTAATVTWTHVGNKPALTSTAATRTITFNENKTITVSGTTAINFITDTDGATVGGGTTDFRVGDTLVVTGSVQNIGTYTISAVSANTITVFEDLRTEANAAGFVLTAHHSINKSGFTASTGRTLQFASSKTITASSGSFINDGHKSGDVIVVSGTTSNNMTYTINAVARLTLTVLENMVNEGPLSSSASITPYDIQNNVTYYYKLRKYDTASLFSDSAEIEITPTIPKTNKNVCLRGTAFTAPWVASNLTVGSASRISPFQLFATTAANQIAEALLLTATNNNATLTQPIPTTSGLTYTFSVYICNNATRDIPTVVGEISLGSTTQSFTATPLWQKFTVTHTATSGSTNAVIKITNNAQSIVAIGAKIDYGSITKPYLATAAAPIFNVNEVRDISLVRTWCRGYGGAERHSGIEIQLAAAVTGEMWTEVYCSSTKGFTPSIKNCIFNTIASSGFDLVLNNSSLNNTFNYYTQEGKGAPQGAVNVNGLLYLALSSSNNSFKNFTYDLGGAYMQGFININSLSNDNFIHNWNIKNWRNYTTVSTPIYFANNQESGLLVQNLSMDNSDFPITNIAGNVLIKGMNGGNAKPANNATTYTLGSTTDSVAIAYTAVYDTIFNELYFTPSRGALHVIFNASSKETKPYTLTGNTSAFSNGGRLYLQNPNDGIEYIWPHKILGVSGFTDLAPKLNGLDLGTNNDRLEGLKIEYSINTGTTYSEYKELRIESTGTTLMNIKNEIVSASDGFYLKLRLTAMTGMKYNTRISGKNFVEGEIIKGNTSLVTATVVRDIIVTPGTNGTGTIWLSGVSGTFVAGEVLSRASDADGRATNVATNTSFALFPSYTSYIDGLQIYTNIDKSVKYPETIVAAQLVLTGLKENTEIRVYNASSGAEITGIENSSTGFTYEYTWEGTDIIVNVVIYAVNYVPIRYLNLALGQYGVEIPVQQQFDRWYSN